MIEDALKNGEQATHDLITYMCSRAIGDPFEQYRLLLNLNRDIVKIKAASPDLLSPMHAIQLLKAYSESFNKFAFPLEIIQNLVGMI